MPAAKKRTSDKSEEPVDLVDSEENEQTKSSKPASKRSKLDEVIDELDHEDEEEEEEELTLKKKKPSAAKRQQPASKKSSKKKADSDDEDVIELDEDEDEDDEDLDVEDESDEDEKPKKKKAPAKKKTVTTTRKGTKIEHEGSGSVPKTKKEAQAAKRAAALDDSQGIVVATNDEGHPTRLVSGSDPVVIKYKSMTISLLKDWLRANNMVMSGKKEDLVARCVDGEINGRLPRCPRCRMGKVTFNPDKGVYICPGFFDTDANMMIRCSFEEPKVERLPWIDPESLHAEAEDGATEGKKAEGAAGGSGEDTAIGGKITDELVSSFASLNPRDAAEKLAKFCKEDLKLSLPDDEKKVRLMIGPLLMSNRVEGGGFDIRKVVAEISKNHPPRVEGESGGDGKPAKKTDGPTSKVAANEPIAALMDELAIYEKKKGGENVGFKIAALKKAAISIRGLNFEITDGVALGKPGKTKVEGIGKGTAKNIQEFLSSGKTSSPYLEYLKREVGE